MDLAPPWSRLPVDPNLENRLTAAADVRRVALAGATPEHIPSGSTSPRPRAATLAIRTPGKQGILAVHAKSATEPA